MFWLGKKPLIWSYESYACVSLRHIFFKHGLAYMFHVDSMFVSTKNTEIFLISPQKKKKKKKILQTNKENKNKKCMLPKSLESPHWILLIGSGYWIFQLIFISYMPYLKLWDKISQILAHLEGHSHKNAILTEFSDYFTADFLKK